MQNTACENAGNKITIDGIRPYRIHQVVPEYPSAIIIPTFMLLSALTVIFTKRTLTRKPKLTQMTKNIKKSPLNHPKQHEKITLTPSQTQLKTTTLSKTKPKKQAGRKLNYKRFFTNPY